jgi:hypothetical protein
MNEITSTHEMAESEWDDQSEPSDVDTDMVATKEAEGRGIEFHVSMHDYTMRDMEALIIEAAAALIVGRRNDHEMAKIIEAKCIEQITAKADKALASVTAEIIDQPVTPKFAFMSKGDDKPVTMREFIALTGQAYLTARVDYQGNPSTDSYSSRSQPRIQHLVEAQMGRTFKNEIEKATNAAINEVRRAVKEQHEAFLTAEKARFRDALAKVTEA